MTLQDFQERIGNKYFAVNNDGSQEFSKYIKWLNEVDQQDWTGKSNAYYGFDQFEGRDISICTFSIIDFYQIPKILTAKEAVAIIDGVQQDVLERLKELEQRVEALENVNK